MELAASIFVLLFFYTLGVRDLSRNAHQENKSSIKILTAVFLIAIVVCVLLLAFA